MCLLPSAVGHRSGGLAFDSLGWDNKSAESLVTVRNFLRHVVNSKRSADDQLMQLDNVTTVTVRVPHQGNDHDCGLQVCEYAGMIARCVQLDEAGVLGRLCDLLPRLRDRSKRTEYKPTFEQIFGIPGNAPKDVALKRTEYEGWLSSKHTQPSALWRSFGGKIPTHTQLARASEKTSQPVSLICGVPDDPYATGRIPLSESELARLHLHKGNAQAN